MEKRKTESFCEWFSRDRMGSYLRWADQSGVSASCLYAMNLQLSESLYVPLQTLEILLRNRVHQVLAAEHGEFWFERLRRKHFSTPLVRIRHLRNRIAHHEPILHWPLVDHHADMLQLMEWLAPPVARWCSQHDRFPELLTRCGQHLPVRNGN